MKILIDAMGGDFAPAEILKGTALAVNELEFTPLVVGESSLLERSAKENGIDLSGWKIVPASDAIGMNDPPLSIRSRPDCSMRIGLELLKKGAGDAFVSAGSTGALQMGANLFVKKIPGISRSAIGTLLPMSKPVLLLDSGANTSFTPALLCHYALMGSVYMEKVQDISRPRVGLLNIGTEEHKGTEGHESAYRLLSGMKNIHFVGNIEPTALPQSPCDVLVADGFSGNILLKTLEGMCRYIFKSIQGALASSSLPDEGKYASGRILKQVSGRFDASEHGGAPLIGISAPVIKAHGNSDARAIKNAIRQALRYAESNAIAEIEEGIKGADLPKEHTPG